MSRHRLSPLLEPRSVAPYGATAQGGTDAHRLLQRLRDGGFHGAVTVHELSATAPAAMAGLAAPGNTGPRALDGARARACRGADRPARRGDRRLLGTRHALRGRVRQQ